MTTPIDSHSPASVGLVGDGDEIAAIADVEQAFGLKLDYADAGSWRSAGDVFAALRRALPAGEADRPETWHRFAAALAQETGIDPATIQPASPLLLPVLPLWLRISNWLRILVLVAVAAALIIAALLAWFG